MAGSAAESAVLARSQIADNGSPAHPGSSRRKKLTQRPGASSLAKHWHIRVVRLLLQQVMAGRPQSRGGRSQALLHACLVVALIGAAAGCAPGEYYKKGVISGSCTSCDAGQYSAGADGSRPAEGAYSFRLRTQDFGICVLITGPQPDFADLKLNAYSHPCSSVWSVASLGCQSSSRFLSGEKFAGVLLRSSQV